MKSEIPITRTLKDIRDAGYPVQKWIVDLLIPEKGITILGGSSGSYKTWVAMQLALACTTKTQFLFQFPAKQVPVLYIDEENGEVTLPNRFDDLILGHGCKTGFENLHISSFQNVKLDSPLVVGSLASIIKKHGIRLLIFDSMVRCMQGEEDKARDVRLVFEQLKQLFKMFPELSVVILHHTAKKGTGKDALRGSGDFAAFADVILMFTASRFRPVCDIEIVKNRHVDLSKWNRFSMEINPTNNDGLSLSYKSFSDGNNDLIISCQEAIEEYLQEKQLSEFQTKGIMNPMKELGHSKSIIYEALRGLVKESVLTKPGRGKYEYPGLEIPVEEVK